MSVFIITPKEDYLLREAKRLALANPLTLETVKLLAENTEELDGVISGKRPDNILTPLSVTFEHGWRLNLSCEEQPGGLYLHLSMSSPTPRNTIPRKEAVQMILDILDCGKPASVWVEEYKENGVSGLAINLLVPVTANL